MGFWYSDTAYVIYSGGNGVAYEASGEMSDEGQRSLGLVARLLPGKLQTTGKLKYLIYGIPTLTAGAGGATFEIQFGGKSGQIKVGVVQNTPLTGIDGAIARIQRYLNSSPTSVISDLTRTNAQKWLISRDCGGEECRNGKTFQELSRNVIHAKNIIKGVLTEAGNQKFTAINLAEDYLASVGADPSKYNASLYSMAVLTSGGLDNGNFRLQFGGHNASFNLTYSNKTLTSITPYYKAIEPTSFTYAGQAYAPLNAERDALKEMLEKMLETLETTQRETAKREAISDLQMKDGTKTDFPTQRGVPVSLLGEVAKAKVRAAILVWLNDVKGTETLASLYTSETALQQTYISYAGSPSLEQVGDYVCIDGPQLWIEFICKPGEQNKSHIRYEMIFRDRTLDYKGLQ